VLKYESSLQEKKMTTQTKVALGVLEGFLRDKKEEELEKLLEEVERVKQELRDMENGKFE